MAATSYSALLPSSKNGILMDDTTATMDDTTYTMDDSIVNKVSYTAESKNATAFTKETPTSTSWTAI